MTKLQDQLRSTASDLRSAGPMARHTPTAVAELLGFAAARIDRLEGEPRSPHDFGLAVEVVPPAEYRPSVHEIALRILPHAMRVMGHDARDGARRAMEQAEIIAEEWKL